MPRENRFVALAVPEGLASELRQLCLNSLEEALGTEKTEALGLEPGQNRVVVQHVGEVRRLGLDRLIESTERAVAGTRAFDLSVLGLSAHGNPRDRLIASLSCPSSLRELKRRLATRLATPSRNQSSFEPRVTLYRAKQQAIAVPFLAELETEPVFPVSKLLLLATRLTPHGRETRELANFTLSTDSKRSEPSPRPGD